MPQYDAFISYNQSADGQLAPIIQSSLQRFAKPMWRLRSLRVFRDVATLAATSDLSKTLKESLDSSRYLILLASPGSAASHYVNEEIKHWLSSGKSAATLLIVLTEGNIFWNSQVGDFDWNRTTALPSALKGVFAAEPKWEDLRQLKHADTVSVRNPFIGKAVASLYSAITGRPLDDVIGEDLRIYRRDRRMLQTGVLFILIVASAFAMQLRKTWHEQARFKSVFELLIGTGGSTWESGQSITYGLTDRAALEKPDVLMFNTLKTLQRIAADDSHGRKVLWVDDNPGNNLEIKAEAERRLKFIGVSFEIETEVSNVSARLNSTKYELVITNNGLHRCHDPGNRDIADCVLDVAKQLGVSAPRVIIYSIGMSTEQSATMKCKGAIAETEFPGELFTWIVRGLDPDFKVSKEVTDYCSAHPVAR